MLRGHYQHLSADPNSLANLDQDLPNNLQREVPIVRFISFWALLGPHISIWIVLTPWGLAMGTFILLLIGTLFNLFVHQCETWCSKERLHRAKTIDLCQNPLTVSNCPMTQLSALMLLCTSVRFIERAKARTCTSNSRVVHIWCRDRTVCKAARWTRRYPLWHGCCGRECPGRSGGGYS